MTTNTTSAPNVFSNYDFSMSYYRNNDGTFTVIESSDLDRGRISTSRWGISEEEFEKAWAQVCARAERIASEEAERLASEEAKKASEEAIIKRGNTLFLDDWGWLYAKKSSILGNHLFEKEVTIKEAVAFLDKDDMMRAATYGVAVLIRDSEFLSESLTANIENEVSLSLFGKPITTTSEIIDVVVIENFTPHPINIFGADSVVFNATIRKNIAKDGNQPIQLIPSSGMLSAKIDTVADGEINGVPIFRKTVTGIDSLPDGDSLCIVSALYATAAQKKGLDMTRIFTVADPVFSADGKTVLGCMGICPAI